MSPKKVLFNPFDKEFQQNPYPTYDRLRQEDPVHKSVFDTWIVTRYAESESILKDKRFAIDNLPERLKQKKRHLKNGNLDPLSETLEKWLFFLNPPEHTGLKAVLAPLFSQSALESMRSNIQAVVDNLLDDLCQRGEMDIIADFVAPLASLSISKIIGLPVEDYNKLINWSSDSIVVFEHPMSLDNYQKRNQIIIENKQYFLEKITEYKQYSNNGLISYLINQKGNESLLTDDEIASICIMLSDTAQDSMKGLIGNGMFALLNDPQSLEYLKQNPDEIKNAVEEFLRYDSPIQFAARMAIENVDIAGKSICQGDKVLVYLGAANRDPEIFPDPNQLNFNRRNRSLAFGGGIHHCLGQFLGKLEAQVAINALIQRLPNISLNTQHISHYKSIMLRRLISLPIKFDSSLS